MRRALLFIAAFFLLAMPAFAQVGALPYHYKITGRVGTGGAGNDYVLSFEVHDANHAVKGTGAYNYSATATAQQIRDGISEAVKARAAADAGGTALLISGMIGVDNDMEAAPVTAPSPPDATTTIKGISILAVDNEATLSKPMKSDDPRGSNDRTANNLRSATTVIGISAAAAPTVNQCPVATSSTAATWQNCELVSRKGAASGYASLDAGSKIPVAQIPSVTSAMVDAATIPRQPAAGGVKALATTAIAANTCSAAQTLVVTGTATSSVVLWDFATTPIGVTGYGTGGLVVVTFATANTANIVVCNRTAASITPGAMSLNVRVIL